MADIPPLDLFQQKWCKPLAKVQDSHLQKLAHIVFPHLSWIQNDAFADNSKQNKARFSELAKDCKICQVWQPVKAGPEIGHEAALLASDPRVVIKLKQRDREKEREKEGREIEREEKDLYLTGILGEKNLP